MKTIRILTGGISILLLTQAYLVIGILLTDQQSGLIDSTQSIFDDAVPKVQHPMNILLHDFNSDSLKEAFIADHGRDTDPFPGYQNSLILSAPGGKRVDATANLPQQYEQTHSATAVDIDRDDDIDILLANCGGDFVISRTIGQPDSGSMSNNGLTRTRILFTPYHPVD